MAYQLKLNVYRFTITPKGKKRKTEYTFQNFFEENFFSGDGHIDKPKAYEDFLQSFHNYFDGKFVENKAGTKAFRPSIEEGEFQIASVKNEMFGYVQGGLTNIDLEVYTKDGEKKDPISQDKVSSLKYLFLMWTPFDLNCGVIMIQSYSNLSISSGMLDHLKAFFEDNFDARIKIVNHTPQKYIDDFLKSSTVSQVSVFSPVESKRKKGQAAPIDEKAIKARINYVLDESTVEYALRKLKGTKILGIDFESLPKNAKKVVYYTDYKGRSSHATLENVENVRPTILLDDSLKIANEETIDFEAGLEYMRGILDLIKIETAYKPKVND